MRPDRNDLLPIVEVCQHVRRLAAEAGTPAPSLDTLNSRRLLNAAQDGAIPAERVNGRWYVKRADVRVIAEMLGALPKRPIGRPRRQPAPVHQHAAA